jgi:oligopeptide transport system substrate-binding protein
MKIEIFKTFILIILLLASCSKNGHKDGGNILEYPLSGEVSTLDIITSYDTISASVVHQCVEPLYEYHYLKRPYTIIPLIAESMPLIEQNGLRYTIKIKKNIAYHPDPAFEGKTRYVKAEDFVTQIKRLAYIPNASSGWWLFDGKIKGLNDFREKVGSDFDLFFKTDISGIKTPDDQTLVIDLIEPYPQMNAALSMSFTAPMPKEILLKYNNKLNDRIIGTGPFMLKKWNHLSGVQLVKNPDYHESYYPTQGDRFAHSRGLLKDAGKRIPFLDGINFRIMKENQTRWLNFLSKKIHILQNIPKEIYDTAMTPQGTLTEELKKKNIKMQAFPMLTYWWLSFNMKGTVFSKNKYLRMAVAHAIDYDRFIELFTNNIGQKANSIYPPGIPGYNPNKVLPYSYNLEKAKEYMVKAGYPKGKGLPPIIFDVRGAAGTHRQRGEFFQSQLKQIGIETKVTTNTFPNFLKKEKAGELQFWQDGWTLDYPDAENVLQLLLSKNKSPGPNKTNYNNPKFDSLFQELKFLPESKRKWALMEEMENIVLDDLPWIMQYYARNYALFHGELHNYRHSDIIYNNMKYLKLDN